MVDTLVLEANVARRRSSSLLWGTTQHKAHNMKIAINREFGGFSLSDKAFEKLLTLKNIEFEIEKTNSFFVGNAYYMAGHEHTDDTYLAKYKFYENRADADLIAVIEELGDAASDNFANVAIIEIPDDVEWHISEYEGLEHVAENHRTWWD